MPKYGFLAMQELDTSRIGALLRAHRRVGVPYDDAMIDSAEDDLLAQLDPYADTDGLYSRYENVVIRNFDGDERVTEMDALIAYLQMLGTLVDFSTFTPDASR